MTWIIFNLQDPNQVPTLFQPTGPVVGYHKDGSANQKWDVVPVDIDKIAFINYATKTYASVPYEAQGVAVVGSPVRYVWQLLSDPGSGWKQIATTDGKFVWRLTGDYDDAPIVLQETPCTGSDSLWTYNPAA